MTSKRWSLAGSTSGVQSTSWSSAAAAVATLTNSETTCDCGADHAAVVREELSAKRFGNEPPHPWRHLHYSEDTGLPF